MTVSDTVLKGAMSLKPFEKAELIEKLISSLDLPDKGIDELWSKESEDRIDAYDQGRIKAVPLEDVLRKYRTNDL
jgi:putative addiction module component (TIGR02574 family)